MQGRIPTMAALLRPAAASARMAPNAFTQSRSMAVKVDGDKAQVRKMAETEVEEDQKLCGHVEEQGRELQGFFFIPIGFFRLSLLLAARERCGVNADLSGETEAKRMWRGEEGIDDR
eukprot:1822101-Rhodomonas_salina.2